MRITPKKRKRQQKIADLARKPLHKHDNIQNVSYETTKKANEVGRQRNPLTFSTSPKPTRPAIPSGGHSTEPPAPIGRRHRSQIFPRTLIDLHQSNNKTYQSARRNLSRRREDENFKSQS